MPAARVMSPPRTVCAPISIQGSPYRVAVGKAIADPCPKAANLRAARLSERTSALLRAYDQRVRMIHDISLRTPTPSSYPQVIPSRTLAVVRVCVASPHVPETGAEPRSVPRATPPPPV